ncbi:MAG TPA: hypothetical protein VGP76_04525 [Planctomycetaceae bacterium]|jgi:hypothetical protein|nr:hypothetical protein [Planctomycetaceae bacterium]
MPVGARIRFAALLLLCVSRAAALAHGELPESRTAEQKEDSCWKLRYGKCDGIERAEDVALVFPRSRFKRNRALTTKLQASWNLLRKMTGIDPIKTFGQRVVIGFRHPSDEGGREFEPAWLYESGWVHGFDNELWPCINIPWRYLNTIEQPEACLPHQLAYPFLAVKKIRHSDPTWVDGMCELLSLPVFDPMGIHEVGRRRYLLDWSSAWNELAFRNQDYAGRLIRWCRRKKIDVRNAEQLKTVLPELWEMDLGAVLAQPLTRSRNPIAPH